MDDVSRGSSREWHEKNRLSWNVATEAHNSHKGDQAAFFRSGGDTLHPEELELLGEVGGKRLVHLQCNAGQDTLSLARRGAVVTGVDISDTAIEFARRLSMEAGVPGTFVRSDIFDWFESAMAEGGTYDIAFSSYGAVCWLSDLRTWGQGIASVLAPGGRFVVVDFHPVPYMFDDDWQLAYAYSPFSDRPAMLKWEDGVGDYVGYEMKQVDPSAPITGVQEYENPHPSFEFQWGIGDIVMALVGAGLNLTALNEYPYSNSGHLTGMRRTPEGKWIPPEGIPPMPCMYGISAVKPG
jgi:SAM-dependent methyltransferase